MLSDGYLPGREFRSKHGEPSHVFFRTQHKISCDPLTMFGQDSEIIFERKDVRQVRRELTSEDNAIVNAGIGAAAGVAAGAIANAANPRAGIDGRFWLAIIGAVMGGITAREARIVHGVTVYKRPQP